MAMKTAVEMIEGLRYKLRAFGVPVDGPAFLFCDNQSVVFNASTPESALKRKHNAIAYHKVRASVNKKVSDSRANGFAVSIDLPRLSECGWML